ncbi:hypothetical protein ACP275_08G149200 [Erythranthe tilingii]
MDAAAAEDGGAGSVHVRAHHIKKRALRNKTLALSFSEKDLKDYVTGFHKRKKKRRKEAVQQQEEAERRKRIERRKKIKLDRDFVIYGGAPPEAGAVAAEVDEVDEESEHDEDIEPAPSVSGMMKYDNGDVQVTVVTSEIAREEDEPIDKSEMGRSQTMGEGFEKSKQNIPVIKKKLLKKAPKQRSRPKQQTKRDKRKGKVKNDKR